MWLQQRHRRHGVVQLQQRHRRHGRHGLVELQQHLVELQQHLVELTALGRADDASRELDRARARIERFAAGLDPDDREGFLAMPAVAGTLAFMV